MRLVESLTGPELRELAYLADQRREREELLFASLLDKPALGAFLRQVADEPARLANTVREIARFTSNLTTIVEGTLAHARRCGIDDEVSTPIIVGAIRELHRGGQRVG